ncbi:MAG: RNase adapter RapZ [Gammaproteobacteria bacterium]
MTDSPTRDLGQELIIVSGLSGSGKTTGLRTLEDLGYYCIDNLPIALLPALGEQLQQDDPNLRRAAVCIDIRNSTNLQQFGELIEQLRRSDVSCQVLFFTASESALLNRFNETRRRHPLSNAENSTADAISREQQRLLSISELADRTIDTSQDTIYDLRERILRLMGSDRSKTSVLFQSFGFKYGAPTDMDMIFDMRCLPNPNWDPLLRPHTGLDQPVMDFLSAEPLVNEMLTSVREYLTRWIPHFFAGGRSYLNIGIGCTGGRHRSVYVTQQLGNEFSEKFENVVIHHRQLGEK